MGESNSDLDRLKTGGGLEVAAGMQTADVSGNALLGRVLGGYELYAHIADGGMSRVYRARRIDGRFDRDVAVKVSVASVLDERLRERFYQEQQILAGLNHPGIAQLFDAGIADEGWPFIVMELVDGMPIEAYCAQAGVGEKIELVRQICAALSFAHARLVVHRDIKPGNVLVTAEGEPKLLDFGIAKLLTSDAAATQLPSLTPRYASPEQLQGQPAGVASDIYQVGLLLAEVLDPELLDLPDSLMDAVQRATGGAQQTPLRRIGHNLPADLFSIMEQCIRARPEERYAEISDLREDLANYLKGFPVQARGNHRTYRLQKFARRNLLPLTASMVMLVAFAVSGSWYLIEVNAARNRAEVEAATAQQVADFLAGLFSASAPSRMRGEALTADQLLDRGVERIATELSDRPRIRAKLQAVLGDVHRDLGEYDTAQDLLSKALAGQRQVLGEEHPETIETLRIMASVARGRGQLAEAEVLFRQVIERLTSSYGAANPETLDARRQLGTVLRLQGNFTEAAALQKALVEIYRATGLIETANGIAAVNGLAIATLQSGQPQESLAYFEEALTLSREVLGPRHVQTIGALNNMAITLKEMGRPEQAVPYSEETYQQVLAVFGEAHHRTVSAAANHANTLRQVDRLAEARRYAQFAYTTAKEQLPRSHMATDRALTAMGFVEMYSDNHVRAETIFLELVAIEEETLGKAHMYTIGTQLKAAAAIAAQNRLDEATLLVEESVQLLKETQGLEHQETLLAERQLAGLRIMQGRFEEAKPILKRVIDGLSVHFGEEAPQVVDSKSMLEDAELERVITPG